MNHDNCGLDMKVGDTILVNLTNRELQYRIKVEKDKARALPRTSARQAPIVTMIIRKALASSFSAPS